MKNNIYFRLLRVNHWFKNSFLFFGVLAAFWYKNPVLPEAGLLVKVIISFFLASFMSAVNYIINQVADLGFDKKHPEKKKRPIASGKISAEKSLTIAFFILAITFFSSLKLYSSSFTFTLLLLFLAGIFYNVKPVRFKDVAFFDILAESVNNPIRFCLGWFVVLPEAIPPVLVLILTWSAGAILMTAKRYDELKVFGKGLAQYRATFKKYSIKSLSFMLYFYSFLTLLLFGLFALRYETRLLFSLPLVLIFMVWLTKKVLSGEAGARFIELFVLTKEFLIFLAVLLFVFAFLISGS